MSVLIYLHVFSQLVFLSFFCVICGLFLFCFDVWKIFHIFYLLSNCFYICIIFTKINFDIVNLIPEIIYFHIFVLFLFIIFGVISTNNLNKCTCILFKSNLMLHNVILKQRIVFFFLKILLILCILNPTIAVFFFPLPVTFHYIFPIE